MQKTEKILIGLLLAIALAIPGVLATTTLNVPVTHTNYTTLTVNCTTGITSDSALSYNISVYYNSTNGTADATSGTKLVTISNTSSNQTEFTGSANIESLTDGLLYNMTCYADNGTDQQWSVGIQGIGIDNTAPTYTLAWLKPSRADFKGVQALSWTTADATSGVSTTAVSVTTPNSDTCPTQSWSTSSGNQQDVPLYCTGTYTGSITVTDDAGNSVTATDDFKVYAPGAKDAGSSASFGSFSIGGDAEGKGSLKTFAIFAIMILIVYFVFIKKQNSN